MNTNERGTMVDGVLWLTSAEYADERGLKRADVSRALKRNGVGKLQFGKWTVPDGVTVDVTTGGRTRGTTKRFAVTVPNADIPTFVKLIDDNGWAFVDTTTRAKNRRDANRAAIDDAITSARGKQSHVDAVDRRGQPSNDAVKPPA